MRRSRTLLALAVGMAVAALATAVARSPGSDPPSEAPAPPAASRGAARPQAMELRAGARAPRRIATRVGRRVLLRVEVPKPGEVELPTLGLTESATPAAAPTFDVLLERAGEHRVVFRPVSGPSQPVGTLVVRPS